MISPGVATTIDGFARKAAGRLPAPSGDFLNIPAQFQAALVPPGESVDCSWLLAGVSPGKEVVKSGQTCFSGAKNIRQTPLCPPKAYCPRKNMLLNGRQVAVFPSNERFRARGLHLGARKQPEFAGIVAGP